MMCEICRFGHASRHKDLNNLVLCAFCTNIEIGLHPLTLMALAKRLDRSTTRHRRLLAIAEWQEQNRGKPMPNG